MLHLHIYMYVWIHDWILQFLNLQQGTKRMPGTAVTKSVVANEPGGKKREEIFVDIIEKISVTFSSSVSISSSILTWWILFFKCNLWFHVLRNMTHLWSFSFVIRQKLSILGFRLLFSSISVYRIQLTASQFVNKVRTFLFSFPLRTICVSKHIRDWKYLVHPHQNYFLLDKVHVIHLMLLLTNRLLVKALPWLCASSFDLGVFLSFIFWHIVGIFM